MKTLSLIRALESMILVFAAACTTVIISYRDWSLMTCAAVVRIKLSKAVYSDRYLVSKTNTTHNTPTQILRKLYVTLPYSKANHTRPCKQNFIFAIALNFLSPSAKDLSRSASNTYNNQHHRQITTLI